MEKYNWYIIFLLFSKSTSLNLSNISDSDSNNLNNAIHIPYSEESSLSKHRSRKNKKNEDKIKCEVLSSDDNSSHDDVSINESLEIPKRRKIPFKISNKQEAIETKKCNSIIFPQTNINKTSSGYLFSQPTEKDPLFDDQITDIKENIFKKITINKSPKSKISMGKQKSKVLRQTVLKFPKNTLDMENSILEKFEKVIPHSIYHISYNYKLFLKFL